MSSRALIIDDDDATRALVARWLSNGGFETLQASSGERGLELARENAATIDVVVLDVMMPGIDGFETLKRLKSDASTALLPVVLLTAHANADLDVVRGVEGGAIDHVSKPFSGPVLTAKVRALASRMVAERELRMQLRSAEENAASDALTKLYNRRQLDMRLREATAHASRHREPLAVAVLDLDHFKSINDTYGHDSGDRVLVHFAELLRRGMRTSETAYRYGGEEFVLLLRGDAAAAVRAVERLRAALAAAPIRLGDAERTITFSAGVASASGENGFDTSDIVGRADAALYRAKRAGRDRTEVEAPRS